MNETRFSLWATRSSKRIGSPLIVVAVSAILVLSGCRGGADDTPPRTSAAPRPSATNTPARTERIGVPILDAVAFSRPSEALTEPADPVLRDYGDLLFNRVDLISGYVLDDQWCDWSSARCVTIGGDDVAHFGGEPLESFVLDADYHLDDDAIEVVDLRALHHPVSDQLRVAFAIKPTTVPWEARFGRVKVTSDSGVVETRLDGPDRAQPGVVSHYELRPIEGKVSGRVKVLVTFSRGLATRSEVELEIEVNDTAPEIERIEPPLDITAPAAIFRSKDPLPEVEGGSENGDEAIKALIEAIVDGTDTTDLVAPNSPGALAVAAFTDAGLVVRPRRDRTDPMALCWLTYPRGAFCERWHAGVTKGGALTSWAVEGTAIDELVESRSGSLPGSSTTLVRAMTTDVVLATTTVTNDTEDTVLVNLYDAKVVQADRARDTLDGDGPYLVRPGETESGSALIESSDLSFDLLYRLDIDGDDLRFDYDSNAVDGSSESSDD